MYLSVVVVLMCLVGGSFTRTPAEWTSRTIYQVITDRISPSGTPSGGCSDITTYCGGTWVGLTQQLGYIQQMGFDAIWISPVPKNVPSTNYHGYAAQDLYNVDQHFGSSQDLLNFVNACHTRNIWVMLDVAPNHMGIPYPSYPNDNWAQLNPFNQASYYHSCNGCPSGCWIQNYTAPGWEVQTCRESGLPDLDQSNSATKNLLNSWISNITKFYGFDAIRVDSCVEMDTGFVASFGAAVGNMYSICEVANSNPPFVASYQGPMSGTLHYPLFFVLRSVFQQQQSLYNLQGELVHYQNSFSNLDLLATFADNHDQVRSLYQSSDYKLYQNSLTFVLMARGIPIVYYGTEQGFSGGSDPQNREPLWPTGFKTSNALYNVITTLITARKKIQVWNYAPVERLVDASFYSFTRGNALITLTNVGSSSSQISRVITNHPYANGQKLCNVFYPTLDCFTVNGAITIFLNSGESKVYIPA